jgi:iron complex outermembrane receptor protein
MRAAAPVALAFLLLSSPAAAQEQEDESDIFQLGTVTFSVNVHGERLTVSEQMETSITRTDIETFEKKDIGKALSRIPGVRYVAPSGRGRESGRYESGIVIRGFDGFGSVNSAVPVFIDGIPAYVPYNYTMDMGRFTTSGLSAISVSKGYSSVLYGPNAMGGVVNIISQRPTKPLYGNFVLGAGSGETAEVEGIIGTLQDKWYTQAGWSYLNREFINAADVYQGTDAARQEKNTAWRNYATRDRKMEFKFGYIPNATDEYVVSYLNQAAQKGPRQGAAGFIQDSMREWPSWGRWTVSYVSNTNLGNFYIKPRAFYDKYDNTLWDNSLLSEYDDYASGGSLEAGWNMSENNTLKGKFDYKFNQHKRNEGNDRGGGDISNVRTLEEQIFFFAIEDTHRFNEHWEVQAGLLYSRRQTTHLGDDLGLDSFFKDFPNAVSGPKPNDDDSWDPEAALFYNLNKKHSFHYSIAKKIRFQSMRDQFSNFGGAGTYSSGSFCTASAPCVLLTLPNPDLKPEKALHHEIGWNGKFFSRLNVNLAWYYSSNNNLIERTRVPDEETYSGGSPSGTRYAVNTVVNIPGDTRRQGFDLGVEYNVTDRILVGNSFSYLHSHNRDNPDWRAIQPAYHGSLYASVGLNDWVAVIPALDYEGRSRVGSSGSRRWNYHPGYALVDLKLSITPPMHRNVSFNIGFENLLNKDYRGWANRPADDYRELYPSPGRYMYANLRYKL